MKPLDNWDNAGTRQTFHNGLFHIWYEGRRVQKTAEDAKRLQAAIARCQPDVVIETGTRYGGSALMLHSFMRRGGLVISIDTDSQLGWTSRNVDTHERNIRYVDGNSIDVGVFEQAQEWTDGKRTMVVLDSDHHAPHVSDEIFLYSQLVSPGCYLVVEDACFDFWDGDDARRGAANIERIGGPLKAIEGSLPMWEDWRRAIEIESLYPISHSPCGWWMFDPHGRAHETLVTA